MDIRKKMGCVFSFTYLILIFPLYVATIYGVLKTVDPEAWVWGCFFGYVIASFFTAIVKGIIDSALGGDVFDSVKEKNNERD